VPAAREADRERGVVAVAERHERPARARRSGRRALAHDGPLDAPTAHASAPLPSRSRPSPRRARGPDPRCRRRGRPRRAARVPPAVDVIQHVAHCCSLRSVCRVVARARRGPRDHVARCSIAATECPRRSRRRTAVPRPSRGQRRVPGRHLQRVDPDRAVRDPLQAAHLLRQRVGVAAVPPSERMTTIALRAMPAHAPTRR
jgi:hypothetical protein